MGSTTPNYGLYKPDVGEQDWGEEVNTSTDAVDSQMKVNADAAALNTTHRSSDGTDHSDVVLNTAAAALNTTHRASDGKDHSDVVLNNTHRGSDGKDHSDVVTNTTNIGTNTTNIGTNSTHRTSAGTDHSDVGLANTHRGLVAGNPHVVTKTEVGLSNVPNLDCTNGSNITTGTIPSSVLPPIAISETFVVASEVAQLALTAQEGDVAVRTDEDKSYIQNGGSAGTMADWTELLSSGSGVTSVNGDGGPAVVLDQDDVGDGSTYVRTHNDLTDTINGNITSNTSARHTQNTDTNTSSDEFAIGDGTDTDKDVAAQNGDANEPKLRYQASGSKWQFSNDGTSFSDMGSGSAGATRGTFTNATLSSGVLTITHSGGLSAPYVMDVTLYDNNAEKIMPDGMTGATNTVAIDLTSYGTLTGTWGYCYVN